MSSIGEVTDQDFRDAVLSSDVPVLVDFWAEWCVPCHMVSPVVEEIAREKGEALRVAKLNVDENPRSSSRFGVQGIPLLVFFKDGIERGRVVGAVPRSQIESAGSQAVSVWNKHRLPSPLTCQRCWVHSSGSGRGTAWSAARGPSRSVATSRS